MARYRKVSTCVHGDDKVRQLSKPKRANGKDLWFYLLTGPHNTSLPGLFRAGIASLAEENEWKTRETASALDEILALRMAQFDEKARVIFLPHAIEHNEPESPNVIRGWRVHFDELPDSPLKTQALAVYRTCLEARERTNPPKEGNKDSLLKAFREAFPEAFGEASREGRPSRARAGTRAQQEPEPEPEPEQEQDPEFFPPTPRERGAAGRASAKPITRAERKRAVDLRRAWGRCLHTPACDTYEGCLTTIALTAREQQHQAAAARASPPPSPDEVTDADLPTDESQIARAS